jgi:hypothetical protein
MPYLIPEGFLSKCLETTTGYRKVLMDERMAAEKISLVLETLITLGTAAVYENVNVKQQVVASDPKSLFRQFVRAIVSVVSIADFPLREVVLPHITVFLSQFPRESIRILRASSNGSSGRDAPPAAYDPLWHLMRMDGEREMLGMLCEEYMTHSPAGTCSQRQSVLPGICRIIRKISKISEFLKDPVFSKTISRLFTLFFSHEEPTIEKPAECSTHEFIRM